MQIIYKNKMYSTGVGKKKGEGNTMVSSNPVRRGGNMAREEV